MNVRLIIPGMPDPSTRYLERIADIAGGFTSWQGIGGWIEDHGAGAFVVESVTIVECSLAGDDAADDKPSEFRQLARDIAKDLRQACVYLAIDGVVEYVKP